MLAHVLSIGAFVAFSVHAAALLALMQGRGGKVNAAKLLKKTEALIRSGNRMQAVRELSSIEPRHPARQLLLFMLSLELPATTPRSASHVGYRGARETAGFDDEVARRVEAEEAGLRASLLSPSVTAIVSGPIAAVLCLAGFAQGVNVWRVSSLCGLTGGVVGSMIAVAVARDLYQGLAQVRPVILPLLRPMEGMNDDARKAVVEAREVLGWPSGGSSAPIAIALGFAALVWLGAAWMAPR